MPLFSSLYVYSQVFVICFEEKSFFLMGFWNAIVEMRNKMFKSTNPADKHKRHV